MEISPQDARCRGGWCASAVAPSEGCAGIMPVRTAVSGWPASSFEVKVRLMIACGDSGSPWRGGHAAARAGSGGGVCRGSWRHGLLRGERADEDQLPLRQCGQIRGSIGGTGSTSGWHERRGGRVLRQVGMGGAWSCSICRTRAALWRCVGCHRPK